MIACNGTGTIYGYYSVPLANAVFQHNSVNVTRVHYGWTRLAT